MIGQAELLARYQQLRAVTLRVNSALVERLSRGVLNEGGKRLGFLQNDVLVFESEDETSVLMDFCIHDVRRRGRNAVEDFLAEAPYPLDSDELVMLRAFEDAFYSIFVVESVEPGLGIQVRDLFHGDTRLIVDVNLSRSAPVGTVVATRVVSAEGISMTTGAGLPVGFAASDTQAILENLRRTLLRGRDIAEMSAEEQSQMTASIIAACRRSGMASHVSYRDPPTSAPPRRAVQQTRTGRNDLCPCGSGKKFKKCCGGR